MRTVTHRAQVDLREKEYIRGDVFQFFDQIDKIIKNFDLDQIVKMDETATQFDMPRDRTLDLVGAKSIDVAHSGHIKDGFTTCLTIAASGLSLTPYVVFCNLKKVPNQTKCPNEHNLIINVSSSGFMNDQLQIDYINRVIEP